MSELAFNLNGDAFEVPPNAVGWRVRKMKSKGAPEVAYGRNGQPLVLPLEADIDDLRAEVGTAGRYRLDPIDDTNKPIANAPAGYVFVHDVAPAAASHATATGPAPLAPLPSPSDNVVIEAMRMNAEIARAVVDRFPQMLEAAATLLRAADGAGLPSREPRGDGDEQIEDDSETEAVAKPTFDINALVAQVIPMLVTGIGKGKVKVPALAEVMDWRKASPRATTKHAKSTDTEPGAASTDALPPIDPETMAHFIAVQSALKPEEATLAREVASSLGTAELRAWFDELSKLSVPQAVQKIRVLIAGNTEAVS